MKVPKILSEFNRHFDEAGFECYLVGGAIRNMKAGLDVPDYDFATNARPEEVMKLFKRVIPTGIQHGTVTVLFKGHSYEVTTYRVEGTYSDSRRPDFIHFTPSIEEDLKRRDFTINSMALNLTDGNLLDPHDGAGDLKKGLIRAIGDPEERFTEDPLRMIRACRFASQLGFDIEDNTLAAMKQLHLKISLVSIERVRDEFVKIIMSDFPSRGIEIMDGVSLLGIILPELEACKGVSQKGRHRFDVFHHSLSACDFAEKDLVIRLSALFHDIGKPVTAVADESGIPSFHRHEEESERLTREIMRRMKFPRAVENRVCHLIMHHMFNYTDEWSDAAVRRFISRVGRENIDDLYRLRCADSQGIRGEPGDCIQVSELSSRIDSVLQEENAFSIKELEIDGNDLAEKAHIPRGPAMGTVFEFLLDTVLDDPSLNTNAKLIELAENFYTVHVKPE